ncbi:leucine-rich repeat protein [Lysinibacillus irui]|uniref:Leucine-rich repeat protein n=1 Tax=Lysinibacillus irui TaxID=2998077 RepID=A0AAJ5UVT5_9BACI|nr:leucine-rich repeat protein [Lysinibacillus irui]WDV09279.1 leucine-rich repeat protein [Lysinibacillus irui]
MSKEKGSKKKVKTSKKEKLFISAVAAGALVAGVSTAEDVQEAKAATPNPVSDFTYTVNNGEVTITGYVGASKSVVFPSTINGMPVVKLGEDVGDLENGSFQRKGITSIVIPNTVKEIGIRAFRGNEISNLTIPSSVEKIGKMAFYETGLKTINLTEGLKIIDDYAFMNNYESKTLTLPSTLESVGVSAFSQCGLEGTLTVPKGVKSMGTEAFSRGNLTSVTFEDGLTSIGRWAFMGNLLTSVSIPKSVTTIEDHAFSNNRLVNVEIPENIISLGDGAFGANNGLKEVVYRGKSTTATFGDWKGIYGLNTSVIFKGYNGTTFETAVKSQGFIFESLVNWIPAEIEGVSWSVNTNKTSAVILPSINGDVAKVMFAKGENLTADFFTNIANKNKVVDITANLNYEFTVSEGTPYTLYVEDNLGNKLVQTFDPSFAYALDSVSGNMILEGYWGTKKDVVIPSTIDGKPVVQIGIDTTNSTKGAFADSNIISVEIPNSVKKIGGYAFHNNSLTSINIPSSVTHIGNSAFSWNPLTHIEIPNGVESIGDFAFEATGRDTGLNGVSYVFIPRSVKHIGMYAFSGQTGFSGEKVFFVYDNDGTEQLGNEAFAVGGTYLGNDGNFKKHLEGYDFPRGYKYNPDLKIILDKKNLTVERENAPSEIAPEFTVKYSVTTSPTKPSSYDNTLNGSSHTLDYNPSDEGKYLHLKVEEKYTSSVFSYIPDSAYTKVTEKTLPLVAPGLKVKYEVNEEKTSALIKPLIADSLEGLKYKVKYAKGKNLTTDFFTNPSNASSITDVSSKANYEFNVSEGTAYTLYVEDEYGNKTVQTFDPSFVYTTMDNNISIQGYWGSEVDVVIPHTIEGLQVTRIAPNAFQPVSESTQLAQGQSTVKLNSVVIPETVTHIGNSAFYKNNLQSITLPQNLTSLEGYAFTGNKLSNVVLPVGITSIADGVFLGNRLTSIDIQGVITQIGADALNGNKLTSFVVPDTVTKIGARALQSNLLSTVALNDGLISIGSDAFSLNSITNLVIPSTVTKIDTRAFNVNPLTYVEFKGADVSTTISEEAFNTPSAKYYGLQGTIFESYITDKGYSYNNFYTLAGYSDQVKKTHSLTITPTAGNPSDGIYYAFSKEANAKDVQSADWVAVPSEGATALLDESFEDGTYYLHTKVVWGTDTLYTTSNPLELDNVPPVEPTLSVTVDESNNKAIAVSVDFPTDANKKEYRIDGGAWTEYTAPITLTENSTIEARAIDTAGNETISSPLEVDVQAIKLKWLLDNYTTATTDDFAWAGVTGVSSENIDRLRSIVTDYISTFNGGEVTVPTVADYETWLTYISALTSIQTSIENAKSIAIPSELTKAIQDINDAINALPDWVTGKTSFNEGVSLLERYATALEAVIDVEISLKQADKDSAQSLVDVIGDAHIEKQLSGRLEIVQEFIDATTFVENAESSRNEEDILKAQTKVAALPDHTVKTQLQKRLDALIHLIGVEQAVSKSEETLVQEDKDKAQNLVDTLPNGDKKDSLQSRLDLVQDIINASNAVNQAELTSSDEDIATAQDAIDLLPAGEKKSELQNRLDAVKNLGDASKAVVTAETNLTQVDHDKAKQLVEALPNGAVKDNLISRLDDVQNIIYATKAVEDVESSLDKTGIEDAQPLVDAIVNENKKDELQKRLDEVSKTISAKDGVATAEVSYSISDKEAAQQLVDVLSPDNPHKKDLLDRLEQVQAVIDATVAVDNAKDFPTVEHIQTAQEAINKINDSNPKKDELQSILDTVTNLKAVEDAVSKSETSLEQEDVNTARGLVDALDESDVKEVFIERLDEVQRLIDAEKAVSNLEQSLSKDNYDGVKAQVDALKDHPKKVELLDRLEAIKDKIDKLTAEEEAENAVDNAGISLDRNDYDKAKDLVNNLEDGSKKEELQDRLDEIGKILDKIDEIEEDLKNAENTNSTDLDDIQNKIKELPESDKKDELQNKLDEIKENNGAEKAVETVEETLDRDDYNAAKDLVDKLDDGPKKDELQGRLDDVLEKIEALESVGKAEESKLQPDVDNAKDIVNQLPDSEFKNELLERLEELQKELDKQTSETDAEKAVEKVEDSLKRADYDQAKDLVDRLVDEVKKGELQERLESVLEKIDAIEAVDNSEKTLTQQDKNDAQSKVDKLPEGELKDELQNRLDEVQKIIDNLSAEEQAEKAVEKTESTLDKGEFIIAQDLVNALEDGSKKNELQDRLDKVKEFIGLIDEIEKTLKEAEDTLNTDHLGSVQDQITSLPDSVIKGSLQDRLDDLLAYREAEKSVSKAEELAVQSYKDKAQELVDQLKPWKGKDHLQERLDKLQDVIDQKEGDLIDKILNDPDHVTSQELADYTDNDVVDEKLKDYIENILEEAENGNITKDDVVQIVRLITFLERSKRSMAEGDITKYEAEYLSATVSVKSKFPNASVLRAIPGYLNDILDLPSLAKEIAELLNRPLNDVLAELESLLGSDEVITLSYSVQYVTEDGEVILEQPKEAPTGTVTVKAQAIEGYELVSEGTQTFELTEDTKGTVITFIVKPVKEVTEITQGSYTIEYVTLENEVVHTETIEEVDFGKIDVVAQAPEGYELLETEEPSQTIELSKDIPFELLRFVVKQKEADIETPPTVEGEESLEQPEAEETTTDEPIVEPSEVEETPSTEEELPSAEQPSVPTPEETTEEPSVETVTAPTIGEETALVRSFLVASLDNAYFTSTAQNTGVDHSQYLYDVSQSTVLVKAFLANPTDETRLEAKNFILGNLYAGEFKTTLLKLLALPGEEIPTDGEDITIIHPSKPPVNPEPPTPIDPNPPVEPPVIEPPVVEPPVVIPKPEPPTVLPEIPGGTTVAETIDFKDGKWTIKNPATDVIELKHKDIKIKVPLETNAKLWEVEWILKSNQHYQLRIWADGKEITVFKKPIEITKTSKKAYVFRFENGQYTAIPFTFAVPNQIQFKVTKTGEFQFSTKRITFKDIDGVFSQRAIEELASRHIVKGTSPDYYSPYESLTRAQFSAMLVRSLGIDTSDVVNGVFKDVKAKDWFAKDVQALYETGIIRGVTATKFNPNSPLTRQQAALMLDRALDYLKVEKSDSTTLDFKDANKISEEAKPAVATMQTLGIFSGKEGNKFDPHANLTRAEMAKVLQITLELAGLF